MQQKWLETGLRRSPLRIVCRTKSKTIKRIEVVTKRNKERCITEESKKNQYMTCRVDKKKKKITALRIRKLSPTSLLTEPSQF